MDPRDRDEDGRTFKVNFSGDGAGRLRERVKEKLKEFMGDYTDDTLVEYVVVLLRNGRHKDEARRELNVFLGDDSDSFVAWLWDHLSSNLHLYVQPKESFPDTTTKAKPILDELSGRHAPAEYVRGDLLTDSEYETEKLNKVSRTRRNREWKGLVQEEDASFPVRKSSMENIQTAEGTHEKPTIARRSSSPRPQIHKKRSRQDEQPLPKKRETVSMPVIDAPRRLLQFAVRDAVKTVQQSSAKAEPVSKRLRSVVSITFEDSALDERPQKMRSLGRVPGAVATALKAAAEAAEDVRRSRYSGSVFDRLGHASMTSEVANQASVFKETVPEDEENESFARFPHSSHSYFNEKNGNGGEFAGDLTMLDRETEMAADSTSDNVGYDNIGADRPGDFDISQTTSSVNRDKKSLMVQYSVAQDADKVVRKTSSVDQNLPTSAAAKGSSKIVNISVNVNTWKPPHYQETRDVTGARHQMTINKNEVVGAKPNAQFLNEKNSVHSVNESCYLTECNDLMRERTLKDVQKESQKTAASIPGSHTAGFPSEDIDSHTVFVSNVHFAATKDSLSRHFNKFGEVLKVIIAIDPATGQPTGSAYVEFLRKESAELALSLNGTSFMSRILKVVRRSSAHPEAAAMMGWPRIARSSPFVSRISRTPFARGILANSFRARLPVKPGPRSLQWKREASTETGPQKSLATSGNSVPTPTGRSFTYLRSESKA